MRVVENVLVNRVLTAVRKSGTTFVLAAFSSSPALSHSPFDAIYAERLPLLLAALLLGAVTVLYVVGCFKVTPSSVRSAAFASAIAITGFALFGPLDDWAEHSAAMHMIQHMLMMVVIAPLWVIAQPLPQLFALRSRLGARASKPFLQLVSHPMLAAFLHAIVVWAWHAPTWYLLALENVWWHLFEHICFLVTAGLLWWAVLRSSRRTAPHAFLALLFTLMHTGFLGALLTFANAPLYGEERSLQSQQLAGLIMWVVGGIPYLAAAGWLGIRWAKQLGRGY